MESRLLTKMLTNVVNVSTGSYAVLIMLIFNKIKYKFALYLYAISKRKTKTNKKKLRIFHLVCKWREETQVKGNKFLLYGGKCIGFDKIMQMRCDRLNIVECKQRSFRYVRKLHSVR